MSAQLASTRSIDGAHRGSRDRLGKGGAIGVALVILIVAALIVSQTLQHRASPGRIRSGHATQISRFLEVNTAFLATDAPAVSAASAPMSAYSQLVDGRWVMTRVRDDGTVQTDFITSSTAKVGTQSQQRFLENNTTNLPNAVSAEDRSVITYMQQRFIDVNTAWLPAVGHATAEQGTIYRVAGAYYYVPVSGGRWEVVRVGTDGVPVIEAYVTAPPPADAIAVTP